jgi:hypothetical protein
LSEWVGYRTAPFPWSHGAGADEMKRIAIPRVGGRVNSTLMERRVYPALFFRWRKHTLKQEGVVAWWTMAGRVLHRPLAVEMVFSSHRVARRPA